MSLNQRRCYGPTGVPRRSGVALIALVFALPIVAFAIWVILSKGVLPILRWNSAKSWSETPCQIVDIEVEWNDEESFANVTPRYKYAVEGEPHTGDRYGLGSRRFIAKKVATILSDYPPASEAVCYVDPKASSKSVLVKAYDNNYTGALLFGGFILLVGLGLTWVGIRWRVNPMSVQSLGGMD